MSQLWHHQWLNEKSLPLAELSDVNLVLWRLQQQLRVFCFELFNFSSTNKIGINSSGSQHSCLPDCMLCRGCWLLISSWANSISTLEVVQLCGGTSFPPLPFPHHLQLLDRCVILLTFYTCARLSWSHSALEPRQAKLSYRIVSYRIVTFTELEASDWPGQPYIASWHSQVM